MIAHPRDPQALRRASGLLVAMLVMWPLLRLSRFNPSALFDAGNLKVIGGFLRTFLPPEVSAEFLGYVAKATLETLAIATAGIALAFVIAAPLATAMTSSLSVSRIGPSPGHRGRAALRVGVRGLVLLLRGVPELVWALVFVRALGLGATAGVLALAVTYGGMLAKVYTEILESSDTRAVDALLGGGSERLVALAYGLLPNAAQELVSYTVYRWECAIRASVVMGFVGAGGLGQLMDQAMKMLEGGETATILLVFLLLVLLADALSARLRKLMA
ncbi:ABC transporter permease [Burkholderia multivorans]|jgi:phosphonate transport system permease protein|uniref:PhnE/PtxC family ABC transporter permease n=1 Tax=Burkholderia TaxID=32008 RepID=UPI001C219198|nr:MULTISPECIES: ABC transporter permease [Burkholderia]MBU9439334.1 ABC transporter permease [Burkholderia multivorans]MDD1489809.1 ABC transporter permease [Burkholderia thailandensis]